MAGLDFPIVCPTLVGRDRALDDMEAFATARPAAGVNTLLLSGEAGIGKSRLAAEVACRLRDKGWRVLEMASYEEDAGLPYAGIKDLLRNVMRLDSDLLQASVTPHLTALAPLLPDHARGDQPTDATSADFAAQREQVLNALRAVVETASTPRPCLLLVEDLHWSDGNTLAALLHLARGLRDGRFTLFLTLRPDDASPEVRSFLAELERERLASELRLQRLTLSQTDEMLKAIFRTSRSNRIEILNGLYRLTEGNPFFVEELLRSLLVSADGDPAALRFDQVRVPRTVQEAVTNRVDTLSSEARRLVELASVLGVRFETQTLEAIAGRDRRSVLESLRELVQSGLLIEGEPGSFAFRHALTREAVGSRLLAQERALLHGQIAEHIEASPGAADHAGDLSYHFWEAGQWEKACTYAEHAAKNALAMYAPSIALEYFNRAVDASQRLGWEAGSAVHRGLASALEELGDFEGARKHLDQALALAEREDDTPALVDCLLDLGLLWASRDYTPALAAYERAVSLAREVGDPRRLARALSRLGNGHSNTGSFDTALSLLEEALSTYREVDDRRGVAETLDLIGMSGLMGGRFVESLEAYKEAIGLLEREDEKRSRLSALASIPVLSGTYQSHMLTPALSLLDAQPYADQALAGARQLGIPSDLSYALWHRAFWLGTQGRYREAFAAAGESMALAVEVDHKQWQIGAHSALAALHIDLFQFKDAETHLARGMEMSREMGSPLWGAQMENLLADVLLAQRRLDEAAALFQDLQDPPPPGSVYDVWRLSAAAEVAFARKDFARTRTLIETIDKTRPIGLELRRLQALMTAHDGATADALTTLQELSAVAEQQGNRSLYWRLLCDLAHVHLDAGDRAAARLAATDALTVVDALAEEVDDAAAYRAAAALLLPASLRQRPARSPSTLLTAREAEIASYIARGMTNRQIADALVVSSRTIETHVANAMSKLGFSTRAQLAAWSAEHTPDRP